MPATKKRRPPMEMEPGEGKKHEMGESPDEEVREGSEENEGHYSKASRKRSAKGAKRTKAPMDAESCGCGGGKGKKCSCDGGCGSYKKMDSALTPHEYLSACELGIQDRPRPYIRARLDASERLDKKCGGSGIAENKQCRVGQGGSTNTKSNNGNLVNNLVKAAAVGFVGYQAHDIYKTIDKQKKEENRRVLEKVNTGRYKANAGVRAAALAARNGVDNARTFKFIPKNTTREQIVSSAIGEGMQRVTEAKNRRRAAYSELRSALSDLSKEVPKSAARKRKAKATKRNASSTSIQRDSVWADGFTMNYGQVEL